MLPETARERSDGTKPALHTRPIHEVAEDQAHAAGMICIGWIDESRLTRETMTYSVASAQPRFFVVPFESIGEYITNSARSIDLVVYHSHDTESVDLENIRALSNIASCVKLVVLSDASMPDVGIVKKVLAKGASGFIMTNRSGIQLVASALTLVASGGTFIPREILLRDPQVPALSLRPDCAGPRQLTQRELDVLHLVKEGNPNKIIAHRLRMSPATVKVHIRNMMRKMGVTNRTQAALHADRHLDTDTLSPVVPEPAFLAALQH